MDLVDFVLLYIADIIYPNTRVVEILSKSDITDEDREYIEKCRNETKIDYAHYKKIIRTIKNISKEYGIKESMLWEYVNIIMPKNVEKQLTTEEL